MDIEDIDLSRASDEFIEGWIEALSREKMERAARWEKEAAEFFDRLPDQIEDVLGLRKQRDGAREFEIVSPRHDGSIDLPWRKWVDFAEAILRVHENARLDALRRTYGQDGLRVESVFCFSNGMASVFDQYGEQMPFYQGPIHQALARVRAVGWDGKPEYGVWRA